jgi:phosphatidylglycerol---prolipoprotein diacylglyceryl transferase
MFIHNFDPILFDFGLIKIRWYSIAYVIGIIFGWWLGKKILDFKIKSQNIEFQIKKFDDLITYLIIAIILGGRLGYVLFYNLGYYLNNPFDILKIWEGGMSFHGALIGIIIATLLFAKKSNVSSLLFLDIISCVAPIGLFFGRIANFINSELYGHPSEFLWSVVFPLIDNIPRHPSQLYEAFLEGVVLFVILISVMFKKKYRMGLCSILFLILYGIFRIIAEQFRVPDEQLGYIFDWMSMGMLLSFVMIIGGLIIFIKSKKNEGY